MHFRGKEGTGQDQQGGGRGRAKQHLQGKEDRIHRSVKSAAHSLQTKGKEITRGKGQSKRKSQSSMPELEPPNR